MLTEKKRIYMWYKVRELWASGLSKSQVSRMLELDRATVRKYLQMSEDEFHLVIHQGRHLPKKLAAYREYVLKELKSQPYLSAAQIEDRLKEHYPELPQVHSKTVYNFVKSIREQYAIEKPRSGHERDFEQLPAEAYGKQAQVDFGEGYMQTSEGGRLKVYFFVMVLSRSRYKYVYFQDRPFTTQDAIYAHLLSFEYFQGIPKEILYDQDSLFIRNENLGDYLLTHDFGAFVHSQPFKAVFCRKADPQSKGKVENVVGYVKKNLMRGRLYHNISGLNQETVSWLSRTANAKVHGTTKKVPAQEWAIEKEHLQKLKEKAVKPGASFTTYNVRKDNTVAYQGNFYTLPLGTYSGRKTTVLLRQEQQQLNLYAMDGTLIVSHPLCSTKGELVRNRDHARDKSNSSTQKHQQVYHLLGADKKADLYLDLLKKDKQRYYHDNLRAILKGTKGIHEEFIRQSLTFCLENHLYNGAGFCEVARKYQKTNTAVNNVQIDIAISDLDTPNHNSLEINVPTSNIKTYENLIGTWNK